MQKNVLVIMIRLILFIRSAITPPQTDSNNIGSEFEKASKPSIAGEFVNSCINHNLPVIRQNTPKFEQTAAIQNKAYCRIENSFKRVLVLLIILWLYY